ncbi:signal peptidase I [Marinobacter sp. P4B1]|uniref:signal peptidase I n=1 Tax=Marinobacter sp. P4B1 TaxID=1119533 RepID=UPI00071E23B2|nr:signal peptidase I [Marinobacter sp. P4B1]KRW83743.1 hypothetical protein AQ621_16980 [Marinobacter sp. P4B1]
MKAFLIKGVLALVIVLGSGYLFFDRFKIGIDPQVVRCFPYTFYLYDTAHQNIEQGDYFVFVAEGMEPVIPDGQLVVKKAVGVAGDVVSVSLEETTINGDAWENGALRNPKDFDIDTESLVRTTTIQEGEFFAMGSLATSWDSRYVGTIRQDQIVAKAFPIW